MLFNYLFFVPSQRRRGWISGKRRTLILTTAAITDLSEEKLLYHVVWSGCLEAHRFLYSSVRQPGVFGFSPFSLLCSMLRLGFWKWKLTFFFVRNTCFFGDLRMLTEANIKKCMAIYFTKKKRHKESFMGQMPLHGDHHCQFSQTMPWMIHLLSFKVLHL